MIEFGSVTEIADALRQTTQKIPRIVGVDGFTGAGKSTVAAELATLLGWRCIRGDAYVDERDELHDYVARLRVQDLRRDLVETIAERRCVILDAVCLELVWVAVNIEPMHRVYVKRVSAQGIWHDGVDLDEFTEHPDSASGRTWLDRQVLRYHAEAMPHLRADVLFENRDSPALLA